MPRLLLILVAAALLACSPRGQLTLAPEGARLGIIEPVFVATTRELKDGGFDTGRSETVRFARYDISIPPQRELGEINWPPRGAKPNTRKHFVTAKQVLFAGEQDFRNDLAKSLAVNGNEAVIFVHGYNNNFSEGLYRVAQFAHDLELPGTVVHYAWPSAAIPLGYVYDRDSSLFARDGLESLIREVKASGARRILLVAHSMGASLTMEALRQAAIRGDTGTLAAIGGVILISPDIDVDVFRAQARTIGKLPQPFVIFGSDRDRVLRMSAQLTGQAERLGSLTDVSKLADLEVTLLDVSQFAEGSGHFTLGDSPALILLLDRIGDLEGAFEKDRVARIGLVSGVVLTVQDATKVILRPVVGVANELTR